jgi:serine protease Do
VSVSDLSDQLRDYFGVKQGVLVSSVESGTPAERAGVKAGDVIVEVGGQPVSSASDVTSALGKARDGAIELHVVREKKDLRLKATIPAAQPNVRPNRNGERL